MIETDNPLDSTAGSSVSGGAKAAAINYRQADRWVADEEAVLQALELLTRNAEDLTCIKGTDLRLGILGQTADQMGNAQSMGHILKRLRLVDNSRRKHHVGGKVYAIDRREVLGNQKQHTISNH